MGAFVKDMAERPGLCVSARSSDVIEVVRVMTVSVEKVTELIKKWIKGQNNDQQK